MTEEEAEGLLQSDELGQTHTAPKLSLQHEFEILQVGLPGEEDRRCLRRVSDTIPSSAFLIAIIEACERFAFYGLTGPSQNYMQNAYPTSNGIPGALGLGQRSATALSSCFVLWCYVTPIFGAVIADQYWGRYKTIVVFSLFYITGISILVITSLPAAIERGYSFYGLLVALFVIGLGAGGIKSNVSPLIAEQYHQKEDRVATLSTGQKVIVAVDLTYERIYMLFYVWINVGCIFSTVTTFFERQYGFWTAFTLPLLVFLVGFAIIYLWRNAYISAKPHGSVVLHALQALWIVLKNGGNFDAAKGRGVGSRADMWNDAFVDELKRTMAACRVFLFYPVYYLCFTQLFNNFVSQAATMALHGIPNDLMQQMDALLVVVLVPAMEYLLYPILQLFGVHTGPLKRMFWGFMLGALGMFYAAGLQQAIYGAPPSSTHVMWQMPTYVLIASSEIFLNVTGLEYAYTQAPKSMKSFVTSIYLLTTAAGAGLAALLSPFAVDPLLTWFYAGLGLACFANGLVFWIHTSAMRRTMISTRMELEDISDARLEDNFRPGNSSSVINSTMREE